MMRQRLTIAGTSVAGPASENALVSVVIPAFNTASTIGRAIESVLAQTYRPLQIVVVDDGSTDDLPSALEPYQSDIEIIARHNGGAGAARNAGVYHSRGSLIAFLDADDVWHPMKIDLQVAVFRRDPDIVLCWTEFDRPEPQPTAYAHAPEVPSTVVVSVVTDFNEVFANPYFGTPGVMMLKDTFVHVGGFREDIRSAEDVDLWLRASFNRKVAKVHCPLFTIIGSPAGLTSTLMERTYRDNLFVIDQFCSANPEFATLNWAVVKGARARVLEHWGSDALVKGRYCSSASILFQSLRCSPTRRAALLLAKALFSQGLRTIGLR